MQGSPIVVRPRREAPRSVRRRPPGPVVKWAGGKRRLLGELTARMPADHGAYFEPFAGGAALFFRVRPGRATLVDRNRELVNVYRNVRDDVQALIPHLEEHAVRHSDEHFYAVRDSFNDDPGMKPGSARRAAAFLYMNKTCFNGLWRVNSRGHYNVPVGRYKRPNIVNQAGLVAAHEVLQGTRLQTGSFEQVLEDAAPEDFVYFDPPYVPVGRTADFTSYTAERFDADDQRRLARVFQALVDRGCHVLLSNSDTPLVRELYAEHRIERVLCGRSINSQAASRGAVAEVIVTGSRS